jgi:hypothetical protein
VVSLALLWKESSHKVRTVIKGLNKVKGQTGALVRLACRVEACSVCVWCVFDSPPSPALRDSARQPFALASLRFKSGWLAGSKLEASVSSV